MVRLLISFTAAFIHLNKLTVDPWTKAPQWGFKGRLMLVAPHEMHMEVTCMSIDG